MKVTNDTVLKWKGGLEEFGDALGKRESGNDYTVVNKFGYLGRWQFGRARLWDLNYSIDGWKPKFGKLRIVISRQKFLNDKRLQNSIFKQHVKELRRRIINKKYNQYIGKVINGVLITESGCVAGMHLKGEGGLKKFLKGKDNADALGTKISEYIEKFGNYNLCSSTTTNGLFCTPIKVEPKPIEPISKFTKLFNKYFSKK